MGNNLYYKNRTQVQPVLNIIQPRRVTAAEIPPPLPNVVRTTNGGTFPASWSLGTFSASNFSIASGNILQRDGTTLFAKSLTVSNTWMTSRVAGQSINNTLFATTLLGHTGIDASVGNSITCRYNRSGGGIGTLTGTSVDVTINGTQAEFTIKMPVNLPGDFLSGATFEMTIALTPQPDALWFYAAFAPPGFPIPSILTVQYNTSMSTTTTEQISFITNGQTLKTFDGETDPVSSFGGTFEIISAQYPGGGGDSPASFPGWVLDMKNPFIILGWGRVQDLNTGGVSYTSQQTSFADNVANYSIATTFAALKLGMNYGNAEGFKEGASIPKAGVTYLRGEYEKYMYKYLNDGQAFESNGVTWFPEVYKMLQAECIMEQFWTTLLNRAAADPVQYTDNPVDIKEILEIAQNACSLQRWEMFGAPGQYFIPDEAASLPDVNSPYWDGISAQISDGYMNPLVILELDTIK